MRINNILNPEDISGNYTALMTPMKNGGGLINPIDYDKLFMLIEDQINSGVRGFVVAGTTAQSSTLSRNEHVDLVTNTFSHIRKKFGKAIGLIVGAGSNCTLEALTLSMEIENAVGPTTFLHVTGYYNNPPQEGLIIHFEKLASASPDSNLMLYNVPSRTNSKLEIESIKYLSRNENIVGIKDASGDLNFVKEIINNTNKNEFVVLSGEDNIVSNVMKLGGRGVISASANVAPRYFVNITNAALSSKFDIADTLQKEVNPLVSAVFYRKNPIPLAHMFNTNVRLPLVRLPPIEEHLKTILSRYSKENLGIDLLKYNNSHK